jgi:hypothetical protein
VLGSELFRRRRIQPDDQNETFGNLAINYLAHGNARNPKGSIADVSYLLPAKDFLRPLLQNFNDLHPNL